jgi:hypothetical protein
MLLLAVVRCTPRYDVVIECDGLRRRACVAVVFGIKQVMVTVMMFAMPMMMQPCRFGTPTPTRRLPRP